MPNLSLRAPIRETKFNWIVLLSIVISLCLLFFFHVEQSHHEGILEHVVSTGSLVDKAFFTCEGGQEAECTLEFLNNQGDRPQRADKLVQGSLIIS